MHSDIYKALLKEHYPLHEFSGAEIIYDTQAIQNLIWSFWYVFFVAIWL